MPYKIIQDEQEIDFEESPIALIARPIYQDRGFVYEKTEHDIAIEEINMLSKLTGNPKYYILNGMYRIVDPATGKEYYYYQATTYCNDRNENPHHDRTPTYGIFKAPIPKRVINERNQRKTEGTRGEEIIFYLSWDAAEAKKVLDGSSAKNYSLYVGEKGQTPDQTIKVPYLIYNQDDFLTGKIDDLIKLGRSGLSRSEPSLHKLEELQESEDQEITLINQFKTGKISAEELTRKLAQLPHINIKDKTKTK